MEVYEIKIKLLLKQNLKYEQLFEKINYFIDSSLLKNDVFTEYHISKEYKNYVHDLLYPVEKIGTYNLGNVYATRIRTIDKKIANYFLSYLAFYETKEFKGIGAEIRVLPKRNIQRLYSITPVLLKIPNKGYWRDYMSLEEFEKCLKENLVKKYNYFSNDKIDENFSLYNFIEFKNKVPIKMNYKNIYLLGDKITIEIAQNKYAQELAYLSLGVGLLHNNTRGAGFMGYQYEEVEQCYKKL